MDEDNLLATLDARGAEFLKSFGDIGGKRKNAATSETSHKVKRRAVQDAEDEWTGFSSDPQQGINIDPPRTAQSRCAPVSRTPQVVVFSEGASKQLATHSHKDAFMSPKVSKLKGAAKKSSDQKLSDNEDHDDISNLQNDALLHRLVHTKLLSGSLNPDLNMTPAQRRKALAGRVLELAGDSKLGRGEAVIRQDEKNRAAKRVREGMMAKKRERELKSLDEAKSTGNYHPALKRFFAASGSGSQRRKRERGLKINVGKFSGGTLKLRPEEISAVGGVQKSPRGWDGSQRRKNL